MKMKALVLHEIGKLTLDEVEVPELTPGTVLLKIKACGICSSDVERVFINGTYHFPTIPGHEFSGQIEAVGPEVDEGLIGRKACVFPMLPCFSCPSCKKQQYAQCSNYNYFGSRCDGGYAEYLVVPVWNLVFFDEELPYDVAALCEPVAVGVHANALAGVKPGQKVLVIGTGIIGYVNAVFAKQITDNVVLCGNSAKKLEKAKELGIGTIALETDDFEQKVAEYTDGEGFDAVFEVVGSNKSICNAVAAAGPLSTIVLVGNPKADLNMEKTLYWKILRKQITLKGSWNSSYNDVQNDWKEALKAMKTGVFDSLITHRFPMEKAKEAFDVMRDKNIFSTKVMFVMDEQGDTNEH
jgi:L-iditol 2-dehydrogenase